MNVDVVLVIVVLVLLYLAFCWRYPYTACGACRGGRHFSSGGRYWRKCRRCNGTGKKIRLGRRVLGGTDDL